MVINAGEVRMMVFADDRDVDCSNEKILRNGSLQEYAVEKILDCCIKKNGSRFYKIRWKDTWEPEECVLKCETLLQEFWAGHDVAGRSISKSELDITKSEASPAETNGNGSPVVPPPCSIHTRRKGIPKKLANHDGWGTSQSSNNQDSAKAFNSYEAPENPVAHYRDSLSQVSPTDCSRSGQGRGSGGSASSSSPSSHRDFSRSVDSIQLDTSPRGSECSEDDRNDQEFYSPPTKLPRKIRLEASARSPSQSSSRCETPTVIQKLPYAFHPCWPPTRECYRNKGHEVPSGNEPSRRNDSADPHSARKNVDNSNSNYVERRAYSESHAFVKVEYAEPESLHEDVFTHEPSVAEEAPDAMFYSPSMQKVFKEKSKNIVRCHANSLSRSVFSSNESVNDYKAQDPCDYAGEICHRTVPSDHNRKALAISSNGYRVREPAFVPHQHEIHHGPQSAPVKRRRSIDDATGVTPVRTHWSSRFDKSVDNFHEMQPTALRDAVLSTDVLSAHGERPNGSPMVSPDPTPNIRLSAKSESAVRLPPRSECKDLASVSGRALQDKEDARLVSSNHHFAGSSRLFDENMNEIHPHAEEYPVIIVPEHEDSSSIDAESASTAVHQATFHTPATRVRVSRDHLVSIVERPHEKITRDPSIPDVKSIKSPISQHDESSSHFPGQHDYSSSSKSKEFPASRHKSDGHRYFDRDIFPGGQRVKEVCTDVIAPRRDRHHSVEALHSSTDSHRFLSAGYRPLRDSMHVGCVDYRLNREGYYARSEVVGAAREPPAVAKGVRHVKEERLEHRLRFGSADYHGLSDRHPVDKGMTLIAPASRDVISNGPIPLEKAGKERIKESLDLQRTTSSGSRVGQLTSAVAATVPHNELKGLQLQDQDGPRKSFVELPMESRQPPLYVSSYLYPIGGATESIVLYQNAPEASNIPVQVASLSKVQTGRVDAVTVASAYGPPEQGPLLLKIVSDASNSSVSVPVATGPSYLQQAMVTGTEQPCMPGDDPKVPRVKSVWPTATQDIESRPQCTECFQTFKKRAALERHMMIHRGIKPFQCHFCSQRFRQKHHLQGHIMLHTGERPHSCTLCNKRFRMRHHLLEHERISHKVFR